MALRPFWGCHQPPNCLVAVQKATQAAAVLFSSACDHFDSFLRFKLKRSNFAPASLPPARRARQPRPPSASPTGSSSGPSRPALPPRQRKTSFADARICPKAAQNLQALIEQCREKTLTSSFSFLPRIRVQGALYQHPSSVTQPNRQFKSNSQL